MSQCCGLRKLVGGATRRGICAIEYCLILSLILVAFIVAVQSFGIGTAEWFDDIYSAIAGESGGSDSGSDSDGGGGKSKGKNKDK